MERGECYWITLELILFSDAEGGEDAVENVVRSRFSGEAV